VGPSSSNILFVLHVFLPFRGLREVDFFVFIFFF